MRLLNRFLSQQIVGRVTLLLFRNKELSRGRLGSKPGRLLFLFCCDHRTSVTGNELGLTGALGCPMEGSERDVPRFKVEASDDEHLS